MLSRLRRWLGRRLADYLTRPVRQYKTFSVHDENTLASNMQPGDVLLVEGNLRISTAIKFLTQSTWSHAAMYVGELDHHSQMLIEADLEEGVAAVPLQKYREYNTRICRPIGLDATARTALVQHMINNLGKDYDLKHVIDLARYLLPTPPVPVRWRRRMLSFGGDDPTRAICSTLVAEAYQHIGYPILPQPILDENGKHTGEWRAMYAGLFTPRDFDLSPYFRVIKPTIEAGFNHNHHTILPADLPGNN